MSSNKVQGGISQKRFPTTDVRVAPFPSATEDSESQYDSLQSMAPLRSRLSSTGSSVSGYSVSVSATNSRTSAPEFDSWKKSENIYGIEYTEELNCLSINDRDPPFSDGVSDISCTSGSLLEDYAEMMSYNWEQDGNDADISEDCEEEPTDLSFQTPDGAIRRNQVDPRKFRFVPESGNREDDPISPGMDDSTSGSTVSSGSSPVGTSIVITTDNSGVTVPEKADDDEFDADISDDVSEIEQSRPMNTDDSLDSEVFFGPVTLREKLQHLTVQAKKNPRYVARVNVKRRSSDQ